MQVQEINTAEIWKFKHLLSQLAEAKGNATSMISLLLTPNDMVHKSLAAFNERLSSATRIKNCV